MKYNLESQLIEFAKKNKFNGKGSLSVALVITRRAFKKLPLNPKELITSAQGQVEGLGKAAV